MPTGDKIKDINKILLLLIRNNTPQKEQQDPRRSYPSDIDNIMRGGREDANYDSGRNLMRRGNIADYAESELISGIKRDNQTGKILSDNIYDQIPDNTPDKIKQHAEAMKGQMMEKRGKERAPSLEQKQKNIHQLDTDPGTEGVYGVENMDELSQRIDSYISQQPSGGDFDSYLEMQFKNNDGRH